MGAARLVLGGAILGLFWGSIPQTIGSDTLDGICESSPCACDLHGRLTCDCENKPEDLFLRAEGEHRLSQHTSRIVVQNCPSVVLMNSSLALMTGLRSIEFININNLTLYTKSFELSSKTSRAIISIHTANIQVLPSFVFRGDIESISLENVNITTVSAFAFANFAGTETLRLEECTIGTMEEQAFKKFDVNYLHIIGGSFGDQVPSRAMNDLEVFTTFRLDGVNMGIVRSSAFVIKKPKTVTIQNCVIDGLEGESFDISARGPVLIKNNNFNNLAAGSFLGIRTDNDERLPPIGTKLQEITFTNNTLNDFEEGSVLFDRSSFRPIIDNILINRTCQCSLLTEWKNNILNYSNVYTRYYSGNSVIQTNNYLLEPIEEGTFYCLDNNGEVTSISSNNNAGSIVNSVTNFRDYELRRCTIGNSTMLLLVVITVCIFLLIVSIVLIVWCCKRHREHGQKRWISVPTSAPDVVSKKNGVIGRSGVNNTGGGGSGGGTNYNRTPVDSRITMVVPDGRLYRETEFHVIVEKAEPLTTEL
ncbi:uncharacterized protein LOC130673344 [Microplitis mediator]|uniref:uncharacterized protein LOC130673344 n=1 Tax=Microplitis mediator TaxID=375433 RepID=UPI0025542CC3|nr:uncharacterized protein LOC130673344 [Microplitis mediator]XP_057334309.1 uncharacterized protein LOC130673344 [Microplitis mediator]XP_057334310.1 uncharacterized protein LOC130673344 [Microplitis mediator]XP_057334311.1 uncharacterized protein LOC130673344 [Microplitis mediator]